MHLFSAAAPQASSAYKHSLKEVLALPAIASRIKDTKAAREVGALQDFYAMLTADSSRAFYGPGHVLAAAELGAIQTLLISGVCGGGSGLGGCGGGMVWLPAALLAAAYIWGRLLGRSGAANRTCLPACHAVPGRLCCSVCLPAATTTPQPTL